MWSAEGECGRLSMSVANICHCDSVASKGNPPNGTHLRGSISNGGTGDARHAVDAGVSRSRRLRLSLNRAGRREYMLECLETKDR